MKQKKIYMGIKWEIISFISAIISTFALCCDVAVSGNMSEDINGVGVIQFCLFCILFVGFYHSKELFMSGNVLTKREKYLRFFLAGAFTVCTVLQKSRIVNVELKWQFFAIPLAVCLFIFYVFFFTFMMGVCCRRFQLRQYCEKHIVMAGIASVTSLVAVMTTVHPRGIMWIESRGLDITYITLLVIFFVVYCEWLSKVNIGDFYYALLTAILVICTMIGRYQSLTSQSVMVYIWAISAVGLFVLLYCVISYAGNLLCSLKDKNEKKGKLTELVFEKHPVAVPMFLIMLYRTLYLIAFYPGTTSWDGSMQIRYLYGIDTFTNHHPPLVSFFYGLIVKYAHQIGFDNEGTFIIALVQTLLSAYAGAKVCELYKKLNTPYVIRWASLIYYGIFTVWAIHGVTMIKDGLYYPFVILFTVKMIECLSNPKEFFSKKTNISVTMIYIFFMAETRPNGFYVFIVTAFFMLFILKKKEFMHHCVVTIAMVLIILGTEKLVYPSLGVISLQENLDAYSILFQQTARYERDFPQDVTQEEYEILDKLFYYDELGETYNKRCADWVIGRMREPRETGDNLVNQFFASQKSDYLKVWLQQFLRHPLHYLETLFECTYSYYYPDVRPYIDGYGLYELSHDLIAFEMLSTSQIESLSLMRFALRMIEKLEFIPFIGMIYSIGFYTWIVLASITILCREKKYKAIIGLIPAMVNIGICLISPINANIRYVMPTMCVVPVIIAWTCYVLERKNV